MIQNEIFCYMKWNISKKTSYIEGNKNFPGKSCIWETKKNYLWVKEDCKEIGQDYN